MFACKKHMARPTKRTPQVEERLFSALRDGNTRQAACAYAGISDQTLANWMARSLDFLEGVKKAEAEAEVRHVGNISRASHRGSWQASAFWLERRRPKEWGKVVRVDIELRIREKALELGLDPDEAVKEAQRILQEQGAGAGSR